jgi:hypothetical protein
MQCVLDSARHKGTCAVVQHDDTPCKHDGTFSVDGSMKVSEGFTTVLCLDSNVSIAECHPVSSGHTKTTRPQWCSGSSSGLGSLLWGKSISWGTNRVFVYLLYYNKNE